MKEPQGFKVTGPYMAINTSGVTRRVPKDATGEDSAPRDPFAGGAQLWLPCTPWRFDKLPVFLASLDLTRDEPDEGHTPNSRSLSMQSILF